MSTFPTMSLAQALLILKKKKIDNIIFIVPRFYN